MWWCSRQPFKLSYALSKLHVSNYTKWPNEYYRRATRQEYCWPNTRQCPVLLDTDRWSNWGCEQRAAFPGGLFCKNCSTIQEEFLGFLSSGRITGEAIPCTILELLLPKWKLNIKNCRGGQGYNRTSNISLVRRSRKVLLLEWCPLSTLTVEPIVSLSLLWPTLH